MTPRNGPTPCFAAPGTRNIAPPPTIISTASTFSDAKNRSATMPKKNGEMIAAIGQSMYASPILLAMPASVMNVLMVTYHAPQTKNSRNIMAERSVAMAAFPPLDAAWYSSGVVMRGRILDARAGACQTKGTDRDIVRRLRFRDPAGVVLELL